MNAFCIYEQLHEAFQEARIAQVPVVLDTKVDKNDAPLPGKIILPEAKGYAAFSEYNADQLSIMYQKSVQALLSGLNAFLY
ncbi:hypothetical protein [Sporolactobacillus laevolacticus]|uniref:Uncharacterized protein n=1 Tax=Sporolactobacillus laevolacticus DSM 442 TaxID=1395513 RepID=V6IY45_9BACL|nr:hypothetical protein [Sporolactobacillus laevolacticus]EST12270.1 hypothetical protein P343_08820 [Sporolactobacillus laevolacticus DSM 442]